MDRVNTYHGQIVLESELDQMFDDTESAERNLALESGISQALLADTPPSDVFGGIVAGLGVTGAGGATEVTVAEGQARDNQGRRIDLGSSATVALSHTGESDEGDYTAVGDGAVITGSCPAPGERIIAALFLVYDENLSDPRTDATGSTIQYRILESFHFDIQIGVSFAHPPGATPSRAALADNKVHLADLLLTNNAGTMELVAILTSDQEWDALTGNYANLTGRRSDFIALEQADFPVLDNMNTSVRSPSARKAIYDLLGVLQDGVIWGSGGGIVDPVAGEYGPMYKTTNLDASKALTREYASVAGAQRIHQVARSKYGIPSRPHEFYDPMIYTYRDLLPAATIISPQMIGSWGVRPIAGSATHIVDLPTTEPGGIVRMLATANIGEGLALVGNTYVTAGSFAETVQGCFNIGAAPWAVASFRFKVQASLAKMTFEIGLNKDGGGSNYALAYFKSTASMTALNGVIEGALGAGTPVKIADIVADTWYTLRMAVLSTTSVMFQINDGTPVTASVVGGDVIPSGAYTPVIKLSNNTGGALGGWLCIDEVYVAAGEIEADMRL